MSHFTPTKKNGANIIFWSWYHFFVPKWSKIGGHSNKKWVSIVYISGSQQVGRDPFLGRVHLLLGRQNLFFSTILVYMGRQKVYYCTLWVANYQTLRTTALDQCFSTWMPRHTRVPWAGARGAANSLIFIPIWPSRVAAKYLQNLVRVQQTKKGCETLLMRFFFNIKTTF